MEFKPNKLDSIIEGCQLLIICILTSHQFLAFSYVLYVVYHAVPIKAWGKRLSLDKTFYKGDRDFLRRGWMITRVYWLFILQLNYSTAWQNLKDTFRAAGSVQHVDILTGPDGRSKGSAVVWFDTCEGARKAIGELLTTDLALHSTLSHPAF